MNILTLLIWSIFMRQPHVLVLDTETTGVNPPVLPVELAYIQLQGGPENFEEGARFHSRFNPERDVEIGALATHHILPGDVKDAPLWRDYQLPLADYLIGHSIDYDWETIGKPSGPKRICTLALSRFLWPDIGTHKLTALIYHVMGATVHARALVQHAHGAAVDCRLVALILSKMVDLLNPTSWEQLWEHSEVARVPTRMPFGKHGPKDGKPGVLIKHLDTVDRGYRQWLLKQPNVDPYLRKALLEQR